MSYFKQLSLSAILFASLIPTVGRAEEKVLDLKTAEKLEVRHSMIGARNTLVFYTFKDQQAVLRVTIDNKDTKFPIKAVVHQFADDVTAEGLKKWLNNQHSDGLFPDVPEPVATYEIPAASLSIKSSKLIDSSKLPNGEFENHSVTFHIAEVTEKDVFTLKEYTGETGVFVKVK